MKHKLIQLTFLPHTDHHGGGQILDQLEIVRKDGVPEREQVGEGEFATKEEAVPANADNRERDIQSCQVLVHFRVMAGQHVGSHPPDVQVQFVHRVWGRGALKY